MIKKNAWLVLLILLSSELCQMEEEELSDEILMTKRKSASLVGKLKASPGKKGNKSAGDKNEEKEDVNEE